MREVILALDVGEARIGLARGELGSTFAFGRGFISRIGGKADVEAVMQAAQAEEASRIVVGLPTRTDGKDSQQTQRVRDFIAALERSGLTVEVEDERFTTRLATSQILGSGQKKRRRQEKGRVDEASAVLILETYLRRKGAGAVE